MRRTTAMVAVLAVLAVLATSALPATADELPDYAADEFDLLFRTAPLGNLSGIGPAPSVTGDSGVDGRIMELAEARGYRRRPLPAGPLGVTDGIPMQPSMGPGWEALQADAARNGHTLQAVSGYRSHQDQAAVFVGKLTGTSDAAIDRRLRTAAAPGYSKHHTGYAVDLTTPGIAFYSFGSSSAHRFLSADNAEAAKRNGFVPSYPEGASSSGPIPEAWEWVYVGVEVITCGRATIGMPAGSYDDIVSCPDYPLARGAAAHIVTRALGLWPVEQPGDDAFGDDDGLAFEPELDLLASLDRLDGCAEASVCPFDYLTVGELAGFAADAFGGGVEAASDLVSGTPDEPASRGDLVDLVLAAYESGLLERPAGFVDSLESVFAGDVASLAAAGISRGCNPPFNDLFCPDDPVTRGQMAAFLVRALDLPAGSGGFVDTDGSVFAGDVARLAAAGISRGCNPPLNDLFCPDDPVTRGQMAAFLVRALGD